jgi:glutathione S-transferase
MAELALYHMTPSRSSVALWMLEEVGEPFDLHQIPQGGTRDPAYLAVNPMGKVPAVRHGEALVTEVAAIVCYLADAFPAAGLSIPIGDPRRGAYLKWLFFVPGVLEPAVTDRAFKRAEPPPPSTIGYGDFETVMEVLAHAVSAAPFLVGNRFTAADLLVGANLRWGMQFKLIPERPEFTSYVGRLAERPALQRAVARDAAIMAQQPKRT